MNKKIPTRDDALALLHEFNSEEVLINHAKAVEAVMRYITLKAGHADEEEKWGVLVRLK